MRSPVRIIAHRNRSGTLSLQFRVTSDSGHCDIASGITISASEWDSRRQRIAASHPDHRTLNAALDDLDDRLRDTIAQNPAATAAQIREAFKPLSTPRKAASDDLFEAYDRFIAVCRVRNSWTDGTLKGYLILRANLVRFNPLLRISVLDTSTLDSFTAFLIGLGLRNTTIRKYLLLLKTFLRWCAEQDIYDGKVLDNFRPRLPGSHFETKEVIYLEADELHVIETASLPTFLAPIRDIFIFGCYTGLRISDILRLRHCDILNGCIRIVTRKTADSLRIELNSHSAAVLRRYTSPDAAPDDRVFPKANDKLLNKYLRAIAELCHIDTPTHVVHYSGSQRIEATVPKWQLITTHCARRTFIVSALLLGIPSEVIIRWTGHNSLEAMRPYVAIVDKLKAASMAKFDSFNQ